VKTTAEIIAEIDELPEAGRIQIREALDKSDARSRRTALLNRISAGITERVIETERQFEARLDMLYPETVHSE